VNNNHRRERHGLVYCGDQLLPCEGQKRMAKAIEKEKAKV